MSCFFFLFFSLFFDGNLAKKKWDPLNPPPPPPAPPSPKIKFSGLALSPQQTVYLHIHARDLSHAGVTDLFHSCEVRRVRYAL